MQGFEQFSIIIFWIPAFAGMTACCKILYRFNINIPHPLTPSPCGEGESAEGAGGEVGEERYSKNNL